MPVPISITANPTSIPQGGSTTLTFRGSEGDLAGFNLHVEGRSMLGQPVTVDVVVEALDNPAPVFVVGDPVGGMDLGVVVTGGAHSLVKLGDPRDLGNGLWEQDYTLTAGVSPLLATGRALTGPTVSVSIDVQAGGGVQAPPPRSQVIENAPAGTTVQADRFYLNPQGSLNIPDRIIGVTVLGAKTVPTQCRGWRDVHIEGYPDAYADSGPRSDGGDLLQIKRTISGVIQIPEDVTIRYWRGHDVSRQPGSGDHPDGVQIMCGRRLTFADCTMENVDIQPWFARDGGQSAGGGPVEDITYLRCGGFVGAEGFYSFRIAGNDEEGQAGRYVPTRVRIIDCYGNRNVAMDAAAQRAGGQIINYTRL